MWTLVVVYLCFAIGLGILPFFTKRRRRLWSLLLWPAAGWFVVLLISDTGIFHKEPAEYQTPDLSKLFHPDLAPFSHEKGNSKALLFVHGFTAGPDYFIDPADLAVVDGYDVFAPLLPGHGTNVEDFLKTNFSQWHAFIRDFYLSKRPLYEEFYILGHSMGGALTLKLTQEFVSQKQLSPTAIALISTLVFLNNFWQAGHITDLKIYALGLLMPLLPSTLPPRKPREEDPLQRPHRVYRGTFPSLTYSLELGLDGIRRNLDKVTIPVILFHDQGDTVVSFSNLRFLMKRIPGRPLSVNILRLPGSGRKHSLFHYKNGVGKWIYRQTHAFFENLSESQVN